MSARYVYRVMDFWRSSQDHFKEVAETLERITAERDAFRDERNAARAEAERLRDACWANAEASAERDAAVAEAARVREALQAVRELHVEVARRPGPDGTACGQCDHFWPCPTVRALDAALDGAE